MKHFLQFFSCLGIIVCLTSFKAEAQISIEYPSSRAIFQRDKFNSATIYIAGSYTQIIDRVEARLVAINGGSSTNWTPIQSNLQGGVFSGSINATGGWYQLEIRGWNGNQVVTAPPLDRVGVGEVFMISGQSNAGQINPEDSKGATGSGASDDRVNCVNLNNANNPNTDLSYPQFSHLNSDTYIAPRGNFAWSWGKLGDLLASRLGVPILFYNSAWTGSAVKNWRESINGTAYNIYNGAPYPISGVPYGNLRSVMQTYVPITGIRAILWLQGEAEAFAGTSASSYAADLKTVIETSRNESGKNLAWMVSQTSYSNTTGVYSNAVNGQKQVISTVPNVFPGPNTDVIQIPRDGGPDGVHFTGSGLDQLANAWNTQLNDAFFASSTPFTGVSPLMISASCVGNGNMNLAVNTSGYSSLRWSNGQSAGNIQVGNGTYRAQARDANSNIIFSPEVRLNGTIQPAQPIVTLEGSNPVCKGNTAVLIANTSSNIQWNTGQTADRINITTAGEYSVTTRNAYGCQATSAKVAVNVLTSPLPDKPSISASSALTFCDGGSVNLKSSSTVKSIWSNGSNDATISVRSSGEYRVKAQDSFGCMSPDSDPVTVKVNALPAKPVISLNRSPLLCEGENITMTSSYDNGNTWNTNSTSKSITVNVSGTFSLKQKDSNGCESTSDVVTTKVNPLPATPTIASLRPTTFCDRDYTTLRGSESFAYQWSNGATNREVEIRNSGSYTLSAKDDNGCLSPPSPAIRVVVNPLPPKPAITASGPTTFCADASISLSANDAAKYVWSTGATSKVITTNTSGDYSVKTINEFSCYSDPSDAVRVQVLALPPAPLIQALGPTSFCDGDAVTLRASNGTSFFWNNGTTNSSLTVSKSGSYSARVKDSQGCFSPYSSSVLVDVKPLPSKPEIRQIGTYTLLAENNINDGNHVWQFNGTNLPENGATLKAIETGQYVVNNTVIYSPVLTCFSAFSDPFLFTMDPSGEEVSVYPNPSDNGSFTIETIANLKNATVQIYDLNGRLLRTYPAQNFDERRFINLSPMANGTYILSIQSDDYKKAKKIMINR
ncbi:T9SS type A sorting domain-containing protein [Dyadobacter subterraneus]|uniref:T9SS type A sorting domain-containing protein n=1 Tax=Dyadobacter subterraneus TaxID=2773304 RepID=A0ABR9WL13_9BACT|nr:T9SS type A sorting domain-containing protein [Dyadobacter subterraneus]MBE9466199.1 T9SS type A sorting domain-containing protein [Dyadobacter subterraneus]